jgi:cystathionine gamma-lyase
VPFCPILSSPFSPPQICLATTFTQTSVGQPTGPYIYSRSANPNRASFELAIASLESATYALAFSSGLAATVTLLQGLASNAHVLSIAGLYGGTHRYLTQVADAHGVTVTFTDAIETDCASMIQENTKLIWIESPSNPTLSMVDIEIVAKAAHERGVLVVVDNTFLSPYIQNPLRLGADIVLHSVTKYINGHSVCIPSLSTFSSLPHPLPWSSV